MCDKHNLYTKRQAYKWYLCSALIVFSDMLAVSQTIIIKPTQDVTVSTSTQKGTLWMNKNPCILGQFNSCNHFTHNPVLSNHTNVASTKHRSPKSLSS